MPTTFAMAAVICAAAIQTGHGESRLEVISKPLLPQNRSWGPSGAVELSGDGKYSTFLSYGNPLDTNDINGIYVDLYLRDNSSGALTLLSKNQSGAGGTGDSGPAFISQDGSVVAFTSAAPDLVEGDDNGADDVFLYERGTGTLKIISSTHGLAGNGDAGVVGLTPDGRFTLFQSQASNLSPLDSDDFLDLYLYDSAGNSVELVTANNSNTGNGSGPFTSDFDGSVSDDGRFVLFTSLATNLVSQPLFTNPRALSHLYLRDRQTRSTILIDVNPDGSPGTNQAYSPVLSGNGSIAAFVSDAGLLPETGAGSSSQGLYVYDAASGVLTRVPTPEVLPANFPYFTSLEITRDGSLLSFIFDDQLFVYNTVSKTSTQISSGPPARVDSAALARDARALAYSANFADTNLYEMGGWREGEAAGKLVAAPLLQDAFDPAISDDGTVFAFGTRANDYSAPELRERMDVYMAAMANPGELSLASAPDSSILPATANQNSYLSIPAISADGTLVVFRSLASDLVANDENGSTDIFLRNLVSGETSLVTRSADGSSFNGLSMDAIISPDGSKVAYRAIATNLVDGVVGKELIYIYDVAAKSNVVGSVRSDGELPVTALMHRLDATGRRLAFFGVYTNNPNGQLTVRDLQTGTELWSTNLTGFKNLDGLLLSQDGRKLAYWPGSSTSRGVNYVDLDSGITTNFGITATGAFGMSGDGNKLLLVIRPSAGAVLLRLFDAESGTSTDLSTNSRYASISAGGETVVYQNFSLTLTNEPNTFVYSVSTGEQHPLVLPGGIFNFQFKKSPILSSNGRFVGFESANAIHTSEDFSEVFLYDRQTMILRRISMPQPNLDFHAPSSMLSMTPDGRTGVFVSIGGDLVPGDYNVASDIYLFRHDPALDSDQDGMPDEWEFAWFGSASSTSTGDIDGDGLGNYAEFLSGTDPTDANSKLELRIDLDSRKLSWPTVPGRKYSLERKAGLDAAWAAEGAPVVGTGGVLSADLELESGTPAFFQLRLAP